MRCPDCGQEWQTNYCPFCKKTFHETQADESASNPPEVQPKTGADEDSTPSPDTAADDSEQNVKFCMHCGQKLQMDANFCLNCGANCGAATTPQQPAMTPFAAYPVKGTLSDATASFILSLVGFVLYACCLGVVLEPIALFLGIRALRIIDRDPAYSGKGLAIAGIIISGLLIFLTLVLLLMALIGDYRYYESFYTP
ncbi:DUF4190 domain-containing protein [candidate division KSB1 bacterium]|nr:DUF4190 domain-containing protein [candidate division KSB1 bacterium]